METRSPLLLYPHFAENYIKLVNGLDPLEVFLSHEATLLGFIQSIHPEKATHRYASDKWSVREVIQHLTDTERVFSFRLLWIIRGEKGVLPPFDENKFAIATQQYPNNWHATLQEWESVRKSTHYLLESVHAPLWENQIAIGDYTITARAIGLLLTGHVLHHRNILQERYGC